MVFSCEKEDTKNQKTETPNTAEHTQLFISGTYYEKYGDTVGISNAKIVLEAEDD